MRHMLLAAAAAVAIFSASAPALAGPVPGSQLSGTMTQSIDSKSAYVGQTVTLTNVQSSDGSGSIVGGTLYGHVTSVRRAGQGRSAQVQITFDRFRASNGANYAVDGVVTGMQANTKNNALKEAAGGVAGMLIGNAIGKTVFHSGMGGLLGAAGGFLIAKNNRENVTVPQGSVVRVRLLSSRRQSGRY